MRLKDSELSEFNKLSKNEKVNMLTAYLVEGDMDTNQATRLFYLGSSLFNIASIVQRAYNLSGRNQGRYGTYGNAKIKATKNDIEAFVETFPNGIENDYTLDEFLRDRHERVEFLSKYYNGEMNYVAYEMKLGKIFSNKNIKVIFSVILAFVSLFLFFNFLKHFKNIIDAYQHF